MCKFLLRLIINIAKFLCISIPLQLIGAVALAAYIPFSNPAGKDKCLPSALRWFDCADFYFNRDTSTYLRVIAAGKWARYCWLAWRNPINYFNYKYMGFYMDSKAKVTYEYSSSPNEEIGDGTGDVPGLFVREISCTDGQYYEYYYIYQWPNMHTCFRFRLGWKIGQRKPLVSGYVQDVFVVSPYHSYDGK